MLLDPVANCLPRKTELMGKVIRLPPGSGELDDLLPELRWIGFGVFSGHWWTLLRQAESVHGSGPASDRLGSTAGLTRIGIFNANVRMRPTRWLGHVN